MEIRPLASEAEEERCAAMMSVSDPWLTYGRDFAGCLSSVRQAINEIHVAAEGDELRGFVSIVMQGALVGYIRILCVDPNVRSQGLGSQLLAFAEERIFREAPNVFLFVSDFNTRARALYTRLGYEQLVEVRDYIAAGYSEVLMRKTIGPLKDFKSSSRA
jgi:ribosomal protein S18 acetylase RimI-like enzyme